MEITETLKSILPCHGIPLRHNLTIYKRSFTGAQAVEAFTKHFSITTEQAVAFGRQLQTSKIVHHVCDERDFEDNKRLYYRLHCHHTPAVLNSYRVWTERVDPDSMGLVKRLKNLLAAVERAVTDPATGTVNYKKAAAVQPDYAVFEEAVCELQLVDMFAMDEATRMAFGINVYNLMIKYAFMKVGIGTTNMARAAFFTSVQMMISGHLFTFNELENGVLRGNRKPPYALSDPFGARDPRLPLALARPDCRIHFALNCGAKSCPPVKHFTAAAIAEELRIVALSFCEQEGNVRLEKATLHLSKILYWYRGDFAPSNAKLAAAVLPFLRGETKEALQGLVEKSAVKVKFLDYDWGTNASEFVPFDSSVLSPNETGIFTAFSS